MNFFTKVYKRQLQHNYQNKKNEEKYNRVILKYWDYVESLDNTSLCLNSYPPLCNVIWLYSCLSAYPLWVFWILLFISNLCCLWKSELSVKQYLCFLRFRGSLRLCQKWPKEYCCSQEWQDKVLIRNQVLISKTHITENWT